MASTSFRTDYGEISQRDKTVDIPIKGSRHNLPPDDISFTRSNASRLGLGLLPRAPTDYGKWFTIRGFRSFATVPVKGQTLTETSPRIRIPAECLVRKNSRFNPRCRMCSRTAPRPATASRTNGHLNVLSVRERMRPAEPPVDLLWQWEATCRALFFPKNRSIFEAGSELWTRRARAPRCNRKFHSLIMPFTMRRSSD